LICAVLKEHTDSIKFAFDMAQIESNKNKTNKY